MNSKKILVTRGAHKMYGNHHGLPGLPQARYVRQTRNAPRPAPSPQPAFNPPPPPQPMFNPDPLSARRLDMLEQRLNSTEQSNRALLDEMMRLQQDIKVNVKKNEMGLSEEREHRGRLEMSVRQSQSKMYETDDRIRRCEEGVKENRASIQQISSHAKTIEKAVATSQQDQMERRSNSAQKIQEYRHDLLKLSTTSEQVERLCHSVRDEAHHSSNKVETLSQDILSLRSELKLMARLMETGNKKKKPNPDDGNRNGGLTEGEKVIMEGKIIQLNSTLHDVTSRLSDETRKRENAEAELNKRVNEVLDKVGKSKGERDEDDKEYDDKMKDITQGFSESERQRIMMEISSVANELNTKLDEREAKLRDDTVNKLIVIENTLNDENKRRSEKEKELENKFDSTNKALQVQGDEGSNALKSAFDQHVMQNRDKINELTNRMNDLDEEMRDHQLQTEKVLAAEITFREKEDKLLRGKVDGLEDDVKIGFARLQASVGEMDTKSKDGKDRAHSNTGGGTNMAELQRIQEETEDNIRAQLAKDIGNMDKKISDIENNVDKKDKELDNKLKTMQSKVDEDKSMLEDKLTQKIDSITFNQGRMNKSMNELKTKVEDAPKNISNLKEQVQETEGRLTKKLDEERSQRMDDVKEIKGNIDRIVGRDEQAGVSVPSLARLETNVDEAHTGMKKLAEAIHVVKKSMGDKLKDETKLREQEGKLTKREFDRLETKYNDVRDEVKKLSLSADEASYGY